MRLQKYIANCGVASRRKSETLIQQGLVTVNDKVVTEMGFKLDVVEDHVKVRGKLIKPTEEMIYILLNKPTGFVTTVSDQFDRKTVTDLVGVSERIFPVGRLDYHTSGFLLLTNDGNLTFKLTHPKFKVSKVYIAKVKGKPSSSKLSLFEKGLEIEDYVTAPAKISIIKILPHEVIVKITLREGKNRQVRKMCDAIGHPVVELNRESMGDLQLGDLEIGKWRHLTQKEITYLKEL
ncbi:pseudouridine synthase [Alkaliphilus metalliredigens QYMF]|uniref:Pseudouridine synthase n=1 Tax=Alkaliphilus metalliredigens (strain QYMF) TaxID=293826 RepID=A6TRH4_ALKMQ|nr:pseudouridine synthase [Alkaliphilus metalliredigens]ABR48792.1 pseudouridine synthase [Alkaliphilus metalliredigens QYMF]